MKKLTALITCTAFLCTSALRADDPSMDMPKQVGEAADEGSKSGRNWTQYAIAGAAIAVAIVALVLVSKNKGSSAS